VVSNVIATILGIPLTVLVVDYLISSWREREKAERERPALELRWTRALAHVLTIKETLRQAWPLRAPAELERNIRRVEEYVHEIADGRQAPSYPLAEPLLQSILAAHSDLAPLASARVNTQTLLDEIDGLKLVDEQVAIENFITAANEYETREAQWYSARGEVRMGLKVLSGHWQWNEYEAGKWRFTTSDNNGAQYVYPDTLIESIDTFVRQFYLAIHLDVTALEIEQTLKKALRI
jgi:hypothetical protein